MWARTRIAMIPAFGLAIVAAAGIAGATPAFAATCTTSAQFGECSYSPYILNNNMWGEVSGSSQTLTGSSFNAWSITGSEPSGGGVKTYPEDQENFSNPPVSTLGTVVQNFTLTAVPACNASSSWEVASDDWLNADAGSPNAIEIMVWEDNCHQFPAGSNTGKTITINGQTFDLYAKTGTDPTYSLLSTTNVTSGAIHMAIIFNWLKNLGYIKSSDGLSQLNMGEEIVSTNGSKLTWTYDKCNDSVVAIAG
jgi:hypothetical protein